MDSLGYGPVPLVSIGIGIVAPATDDKRIVRHRERRPVPCPPQPPAVACPLLGSGLFFDGSGKIQCLPVYPFEWPNMPDERVVRLFERAAPIQRQELR